MIKTFFVKLIKLYQRFLSIISPNCCRFYPSCSQYCLEQIETNNFFKAILLSIYRILRCSPLSKGGYDYVIVKKDFSQVLYIPAKKHQIKYWFISTGKKKYYFVIKA